MRQKIYTLILLRVDHPTHQLLGDLVSSSHKIKVFELKIAQSNEYMSEIGFN